MKKLEDFDLLSKHGRYQARQHGFDIPKMKRGGKQPDFWSLIEIKSESECWNWNGKLNQWGYGRYIFNGMYAMSHRVSYQLTTGKNIDGLIAMHICDNPACCNPKHIAIGTHADNQRDKFQKNRQAKGEKNGQSLLTEAQVLEARQKYIPKIVTYKMLAKEYGVSRDTIQKAIRGIYWKHI
jgi:hypothetical protein